MKAFLYFPIIAAMVTSGCSASGKKEVIVFHAGSLSVPLKKVAMEYEKIHPGTSILLESAGSLVCARKVTELKKPCDIIASSDYFVINKILMPDYASWAIRFATNEIVIAFTGTSKYSGEINSANWTDLLLRDDVIYSRSDPDSDPCGYRTIFTLMLAEKFYNRAGLMDAFLTKNKDYIRPKEVDLVALLESNVIDYMFQYKSVAIQHGFRYIELPKEINLSDPSKNELYSAAFTEIKGSRPGEMMKVTGDYINYSITVLDRAPNREDADDFLDFMLSPEGISIFKENGQDPIIPYIAENAGRMPSKIARRLKASQESR